MAPPLRDRIVTRSDDALIDSVLPTCHCLAMAKYDPLTERLARAAGDTMTFTFQEIDELVNGLPASARQHSAWWANETGPSQQHVQSRAWLGAGWRVDHVDLSGHRVIFRRA